MLYTKSVGVYKTIMKKKINILNTSSLNSKYKKMNYLAKDLK